MESIKRHLAGTEPGRFHPATDCVTRKISPDRCLGPIAPPYPARRKLNGFRFCRAEPMLGCSRSSRAWARLYNCGMPFQTEPTLRQIVADASARLGGVEARHEAELLLLHVLDRPRSWLFAHATDPLAAADQAAFETLLARRVAGEPVAYLTGRRGFWAR